MATASDNFWIYYWSQHNWPQHMFSLINTRSTQATQSPRIWNPDFFGSSFYEKVVDYVSAGAHYCNSVRANLEIHICYEKKEIFPRKHPPQHYKFKSIYPQDSDTYVIQPALHTLNCNSTKRNATEIRSNKCFIILVLVSPVSLMGKCATITGFTSNQSGLIGCNCCPRKWMQLGS